LAYGGSALVAFALDVRLRRDGGTGLVELVRDLCARPDERYDLTVLQRWLEEHGQADFWSAFLAGTQRPDLDADLDFAGFVLREVEVPLTYLGLRIEPEGGVGRIVAIDPEGPAAGSGLQLGDEVRGRAPYRVETVRVAARVDTPYRYGLELYDPRAELCEVHVIRDGQELMFAVAPRPMPGGLERKLEDELERQARFFGTD
jgi:predicted metalloprotease with PDZ domain